MPDEETKKKIDVFLKEYGELVAKHKVDIVAFPMFQPDGNGGFKVMVHSQAVSTENQPIKSPFVPTP